MLWALARKFQLPHKCQNSDIFPISINVDLECGRSSEWQSIWIQGCDSLHPCLRPLFPFLKPTSQAYWCRLEQWQCHLYSLVSHSPPEHHLSLYSLDPCPTLLRQNLWLYSKSLLNLDPFLYPHCTNWDILGSFSTTITHWFPFSHWSLFLVQLIPLWVRLNLSPKLQMSHAS